LYRFLEPGNMDCKYNVKPITSLYDSCNKCGLPKINCICYNAPEVTTNAKIWILSTEKEFYRPSNTARLLKLINPHSTEIFLWERTKQPEKLIENITNYKYETYLLFPIEDDNKKCTKAEYKSTGKIPAFILIDGTWKEARKILRKSDYLNKLPRISLEPNFKSQYDLRRGATEGNLCTIEAAIEVLKINNELENSQSINDFYKLFLSSYKAGASGHKL
jgi:DTW domain-containing protein YfiP